MKTVLVGSIDVSMRIRLVAPNGSPVTDAAFDDAGLELWVWKLGDLVDNTLTPADIALDDPHTDGGFTHAIDGEYRVDFPDTWFNTVGEYLFGITRPDTISMSQAIMVVEATPESVGDTIISIEDKTDIIDSIVDQILTDVHVTGVQVADKTGYSLSTSGIADIWDEVLEAPFTARQLNRGYASVLFGKSSNTGRTFRDLADSKNRVVASLINSNRTSVILDLT